MTGVPETYDTVRMQGGKRWHRPPISRTARHIPGGAVSRRIKISHSLTFHSLLSSSNRYVHVTSLFPSALLHLSTEAVIFVG
jgi:hypothetical protein